MNLSKHDLDYTVTQINRLCRIPSPSGFTRKAENYLLEEFRALGYDSRQTRKGSVLVNLGGKGSSLGLAAHIDTLGAMVRSVKPNGRLRLTKIGGFPENTIEGENCLIHTRFGREFTGTIQLTKASVHVFAEIEKLERNDTTIEVVLDEKVNSKEAVLELGIHPGDFISFDPRIAITPSGFIKSRHLDDKAGAGILLTLAKIIKEQGLKPARNVSLLFTTYEEVGHGGAAGIPEELVEMISVDMGAVGDDLQTDEFKVSICAKDSRGPYDFDVTNRLIRLADSLHLNYAVDVYPRYGSDVEAALAAGYDLKHGLIGPGVFASHGYERTHREGIENTLRLLVEYIQQSIG